MKPWTMKRKIPNDIGIRQFTARGWLEADPAGTDGFSPGQDVDPTAGGDRPEASFDGSAVSGLRPEGSLPAGVDGDPEPKHGTSG